MAEAAKVLYIVVVDDGDKREKGKESFRYTRPVLQSCLQLMGCKPRHAFKISQRVFESIRNESSSNVLLLEGTEIVPPGKAEACNHLGSGKDDRSKSIPFELYKARTTVVVRRKTFLNVVCDAQAEYKYVGPNQQADLALACRYGRVFYLYWK
ncbi:hypothetical protein EV2_006752 [Malus domestica]